MLKLEIESCPSDAQRHPPIESQSMPTTQRKQAAPGRPRRCASIAALHALAASILALPIGVHGTEKIETDKLAQSREEAAQNYLSNTQRLLENQILPSIKRGILKVSTVHPPALGIVIIDDPSPFHIAAVADKQGAILVRISLGYLAMHDAALDAAGLAGVLHRQEDFRRYLRYQLTLARENEIRTKRGQRRVHTKAFGEFLNLEPDAVQAIYAQPQWRKDRQDIGADSLGWTVAYLLALHDPKLSGDSGDLPTSLSAAKLADASGMFPAPPFSTAYQLGEVTNPAPAEPSERRLLCRAADLLESGNAVLKASGDWRSRAAADERLRIRIEKLGEDVSHMRRDARCMKRDSTEA